MPTWIYVALYLLAAFQSATLAMTDVRTHPIKVMLIAAFWPLDAIHGVIVLHVAVFRVVTGRQQ